MTEAELNEVGVEVVSLLRNGDYQKIADKYSYALCFDREPSLAIKEDFEAARDEAVGEINDSKSTVNIKYFNENDSSLVALIECDFPLEFSTGIFVELIQNSKGSVYIEGISSYYGGLNA
ncbi:hypothetical protein [Ketobacter alkanivorans]|uniref:Uncharacterized protein n=1 Tax=Ketobacter alkanivorans TaxID=1917421 RepID=A0A2K9LR30_9GAMM|nr:hypothetical protein [Ketobacter alkanivorans]AUM14700.1 hypothetical protein Kalk_20700 [Ketobacter alkanivorans]